jgi:hypothetical protein
MTAQETAAKENRHNAWIRLLYMVLFVVIFNVVEAVSYIVLVVQFIFHLFTGKPNDRLKELGASLAAYVRELVAFFTYASEDLPYPFGSWPGSQSGGTVAKS